MKARIGLLIFLLVGLLIAVFPVTSYANGNDIQKMVVQADTVLLPINRKEERSAKEVSVSIRVKNNPGVSSISLRVSYGDTLELKTVQFNQEMHGATGQSQNIVSPYILQWVNGTGEWKEDGVFATLTFEVSKDAEIGVKQEIAISFDQEDIYNLLENDVPTVAVNGGVMINYAGDINGDNKVNNKDITRLFQHRANWDVDVNKYLVDTNGDNKVNNKDITRLFQYLADWDVTLYPKDGFAIDSENGEAHEHSYGAWTYNNELTHKRVCSCGNSQVESHTWDEGVATKEATSTEEGIKTYTCTICGGTKTEVTTIQQHNHSDECYSNEWISDGGFHWHDIVCGQGDPALNRTIELHDFKENHKCICGEVEKHTVTFNDYDGSILAVRMIDWGTEYEIIDTPNNPTRKGYIFNGWGDIPEIITEDVVLTARYVEYRPTISFTYIDVDNNEKTVSQTVEYGVVPTPPNDDEVAEYIFIWKDEQGIPKYKALAFLGWDSELEPATSDKTYTAQYDKQFERPIIAVEFKTDYNSHTVEARVVLCNIKSDGRKMYFFNFEMSYKAAGGTYTISDVDYFNNVVENQEWVADNNFICEWNNKTDYKTMSFAWSTPNLKADKNGTSLVDDFDTMITIHFSSQGTINNEYIKIISDSCRLVISDDGGETMQSIQPIILYSYHQ